MSDSVFEKARESMVVSQLQPNGVTSEKVLNAYRAVPRENFVPENLRHISYLDESLSLADGGKLLEPMLHALLVERLDIEENDKVLTLGDPSGYSEAILSQLSGNVTSDSGKEENFDAILINGAVAEIPDELLRKLNPGGRLACILMPAGKAMGRLVLATKELNGTVSRQVFNDASAAYLAEFAPKPGFVF